MINPNQSWVLAVTHAMGNFATQYRSVYSNSERAQAAYFEIGCFLALVTFYHDRNFIGEIANLAPDGSYRYLTTPSGNPNNFSYMVFEKNHTRFEMRQQVRIKSHVHPDIAFTPDIVVIRHDAKINQNKDIDYAGGKRTFFCVNAVDVIAAHECKSMAPFPELLVSFIGSLLTAHDWYQNKNWRSFINPQGDHVAPCLFVGGTARTLHRRMIKALMDAYPINIVTDMHGGKWKLAGKNSSLKRIHNPLKACTATHPDLSPYPPPAASPSRLSTTSATNGF